jgi:hypothetical protein
MLREFGDSSVRWLLLNNLPGKDLEWLGAVMDEELMSPMEALACKDGLGSPEPNIQDLARLLIPRGVPAEAIASRARWGTYWGEESDRCAALVKQFEEMAVSAESSVAAVGRAGVLMFSNELDVARQKERRRRVRGL